MLRKCMYIIILQKKKKTIPTIKTTVFLYSRDSVCNYKVRIIIDKIIIIKNKKKKTVSYRSCESSLGTHPGVYRFCTRKLFYLYDGSDRE